MKTVPASVRGSVLAVAFAMGFAAAGVAGAQPAPLALPSNPSPPHERLRFFEGTWTTADSTAEDGFREVCAWLPEGRRHMVCRSRWMTPSGPREALSVFSHDSTTGDYLYTGFRAGGAHVIQRGREQNGRWLFHSERGEGADRVRARVTIEPSDDGFTFLSESAKGNEPWGEGARVLYRRLAR